MTYGQLFMKMHPDVKVKANGTCVWLYFDMCNYHTFKMDWWNAEIPKELSLPYEETIQPGDEVIVEHGARNGIPFHEMAVVTRNDEDHFCYMLRDGTSYHCRRSYANPVKTGRRFDIPLVLKQMEEEFE